MWGHRQRKNDGLSTACKNEERLEFDRSAKAVFTMIEPAAVLNSTITLHVFKGRKLSPLFDRSAN
jgi:hypothetical protein